MSDPVTTSMSWSLVTAVSLTATAVLGHQRDIAAFPACLTDSDCDTVSKEKGADYKCFQSMCYPWDRPDLAPSFRSCTKRSQCRGMEGGQDGDCFRHSDRRAVFSGLCLTKR